MDLFQHVRVIPLGGGQPHFFFSHGQKFVIFCWFQWAEKAKNRPTIQKIDFFKVRDIDTPIQPRKKKHQTNVSSALKTF